MNYIIVDLDGTLCNCEHRRHFVQQENKDWDSFYAGIPEDEVNKWCLDIIQCYQQAGDEIILCTGRSSRYTKETIAWLESNDILCEALYFCRDEDDHRPDTVVKLETYKEHIEPEHGKPLFVIDDRASVVKMWRDEGLVCLQCDEGNF